MGSDTIMLIMTIFKRFIINLPLFLDGQSF